MDVARTLAVLLVLVTTPFAGYSQTANFENTLQKLKSKSAAVRKAAARTLGAGRDARAIEPLAATLKDDEDTTVKVEAVRALRAINDPRTIELLVAELSSENYYEHYDVGYEIGEALKEWGADAVPPLIVLLKADPQREDVMQILGDIGAPAVEPLLVLMKDENTREAAAVALGLTRDANAVEPLIAALKDEDPQFRQSVAQALGRIKNARAAQVLNAALKERDLFVVAAAYEFYIESKNPAADAVLIEALNEHGDLNMAEAYLNSGNRQLASGAREWAESNGYQVNAPPPAAGRGKQRRRSRRQ